MNSLRLRLFLLLLAATTLVWSAAAAWTYFSTRADVQRVLDRRLTEAAGMVASLAQGSGGAVRGRAPVPPAPIENAYSRQLSCQIWTLDWRLVGRSGGAPAQPLGLGRPGFSERTINGERWRVYTLVDRQLGLRILVGDNLEVRQNLIADMMRGLLLPAIVGMLALAVLLWAAIAQGLWPLQRLARELARRAPSDHRPLEAVDTARELRPLVTAINGLFARLEQLRSNERHFIASAAHELQTPLAGLRAHAQIALTADAGRREQSLQAIQESVDRTSRLVQQLLDLSREEAEAEPLNPRWLPLRELLMVVNGELEALLRKREITLALDPAAAEVELHADEASLLLILRNLIRNAVQHAPPLSEVAISAGCAPAGDWIAITDAGPGIPETELGKVRSRFVRGSRAKGEGSGLGLSIVELVLERNGGRLDLSNNSDGGLRATVHLHAGAVRTPPSADSPPG